MLVGCRICLVALALVLTACSSDSSTPTQTTAAARAEQSTTPTTTETPRAESDTSVTPTEPRAAVEAEPTVLAKATVEPTSLPQPSATAVEPTRQCERLTDFTIEAQNLSWFIVNDNVMGGRSNGGPTFDGSSMVFSGEINTDGGGFSSVRIGLGADTFTGFSELVVRARTDGREYKLTLEDSLSSRDRRVSQQGVLDFAPSAEWQTVRVAFADLQPKIFGRSVQSEPFRSDLATQLGVMISDGVDGPFRLEVDWIEACV